MKNRPTPARLVGIALALALFLGISPHAAAEEILDSSASPAPSISANPQVSPSDTSASREAETVTAQDEEPSQSSSPSSSSSESSEPTATPSVTPTPTPTASPTTKPNPPPTKPVLKPAPQIWGHRAGVPGVRENTAVAFKRAIASKTVNALETDIRKTKNNHWVLNHDASIKGKKISKNKLKALRKKQGDLLTTPGFFYTVRNSVAVQIEIKEKKISEKQVIKLYRQSKKYGTDVSWSSFNPGVLKTFYAVIKKKYGTAAANRLKLAYITGVCVSPKTLAGLRAKTVDLRYYSYRGGTNLACAKSLDKAGFDVALWTLNTSKAQYDNAWAYGATAVITDNVVYARKTAYPATEYQLPPPNKGILR